MFITCFLFIKLPSDMSRSLSSDIILTAVNPIFLTHPHSSFMYTNTFFWSVQPQQRSKYKTLTTFRVCTSSYQRNITHFSQTNILSRHLRLCSMNSLDVSLSLLLFIFLIIMMFYTVSLLIIQLKHDGCLLLIIAYNVLLSIAFPGNLSYFRRT